MFGAYGYRCYNLSLVMATITLDDVKYVAVLAKIALTDEQAARLQQELDTILGYVKQLDALDTAGIEPTYQVTGLKNVMREDEIIDYQVSRAELLRNAPAQQENQIKVPKVL
jgi:aspartyl-tRNA(Asn)/glutamyl-tRNA(Gln) amidotransferase subunit C